jgi:carbon-monoxide dehydrogenase medium subunit
MKPAAFDYAAPRTLAEAVALLDRHDGAKIISGGQSLMPLLAFRLAAPSLLVDIGKIEGLNRIEITPQGVDLGARVRWVDIEKDARLTSAHPLLSAAIAHVAHYQIRNRGTVGGSVVHADPAAEMPGVAVTCDAQMELLGPAGLRTVPASDFFLGPLDTAIKPNEILCRVRLPAWPGTRKSAFEEFSMRKGDFALAGALVFYDLDDQGRARNAHIGGIGIGGRPVRVAAAEARLNGQTITKQLIAQVGEAGAAAIDPFDDLHASAQYRRALFGTLIERALTTASGLK